MGGLVWWCRAEHYACDDGKEAFVHDFVAAWVKVCVCQSVCKGKRVCVREPETLAHSLCVRMCVRASERVRVRV